MANVNVSFKTKKKQIDNIPSKSHLFIIINYLLMERKPIFTKDVIHAIRQTAAISWQSAGLWSKKDLPRNTPNISYKMSKIFSNSSVVKTYEKAIF